MSSIHVWHDQLSRQCPAIHMQLVANLRWFVNGLGVATLGIGTLYSGTDVTQMCLEALAQCRGSMRVIDLHISHRFMCEKHEDTDIPQAAARPRHHV